MCSLNNAGAQCIFSITLPDVQHESVSIVPRFLSFIHTSVSFASGRKDASVSE